MSEYIIWKGDKYVLASSPPEPPAEPEITPVPEPLDSWLVTAGDGNDPAMVLMDEFFEDRTQNLAQTNMTRKHTIYNDPDHTPSGKILVHINGTPWEYWFQDLFTLKNWEAFITPKDGFMDTRDPTTTDLPLMVCPSGGALLNIKESVRINGNWWEIVETLDFWKFPEKIDGVWYYDGEALSWWTHPHLFFTRTNRVTTKFYTWLTRNLINAASDGGLRGGKGDEHWPAVSHKVAAQPRYQLYRYPKLPATLLIHNDSIIVDGNLVDRIGKEIVVDAYRFQGSDTYVREQSTGKWYLADKMLVRADASVYAPGNGFDYRCFVSLPSKPKEPWMGYRGFRSPVCGWTGLERNLWTQVVGLVNKLARSLWA